MGGKVLIFGIGGIGRAVAHHLRKKNVNIHLFARSSDKLAALSNELGGNIPYTVCDASKPDTIESIIATALSSSSSGSTNDVNGLVYAIGTIPLKPLRSTTYQDYVDTYNVNFTSAALAVKAATPALTTTAKANSSTSSVVLFSSVAASVGFPNHTAIGAAKGAIEAFVRTSAAELSPFVRINAIAPSLTDTPLASRLLSTDAMKQSLGGMHPLPRVGTVGDMAATSGFLLDNEQSGWMTGQVLHVDGGRSTVRPKN